MESVSRLEVLESKLHSGSLGGSLRIQLFLINQLDTILNWTQMRTSYAYRTSAPLSYAFISLLQESNSKTHIVNKWKLTNYQIVIKQVVLRFWL